MQAGGVMPQSTKKAGPVDPNSAFMDVQTRTLRGEKIAKNGTSLKKPSDSQTGLKKLPTAVRNKMGYAKKGVKMMTAKSDMKAEDGATLRSGQYKRIGRISAKNPERAESVASRMVERDTRKSRGKEFVKSKMSSLMPKSKNGIKMKKMMGGGKCKDGC